MTSGCTFVKALLADEPTGSKPDIKQKLLVQPEKKDWHHLCSTLISLSQGRGDDQGHK